MGSSYAIWSHENDRSINCHGVGQATTYIWLLVYRWNEAHTLVFLNVFSWTVSNNLSDNVTLSPSNSEKKRLNLFWITLFQISKSHSTHSKMLQLMRWLFIIKEDGKTSNITHQNQVNITSRHMDCVIVPLGSHIIYWLTLDLIHRTVLKSIIKVTPKIFLNIY